MGPIVHPDDYNRWQYVVRDMRTKPSEQDVWLCMVAGFTVALLAAGFVGMIMAKTWLPMFARAVITVGVFALVGYVCWNVCKSRRELAARLYEADDAEADAAPAPVTRAAAPVAAAPAPAAASVAPAAPAAAAEPEAPAEVGTRPTALEGPREGGGDDLTKIKGVGPKLAELCNSLGFYHFDQIAAWTADEVAWVDENLEGFKGRVSRDDWVAQAGILAAGGETEFSARQ